MTGALGLVRAAGCCEAVGTVDVPASPPLAGAVLVGGRSRRMGRPKAFLPLGAGTVLDAVLGVLRCVADPVALVGRPDLLDAYGNVGLPLVTDAPGRPSSVLAGLEAALRWSPHERVLVLACDTPAVPVALLAELAAMSGAMVSIAQGPYGAEPLLASYHRGCLPAIEAAFARGDLRAVAFHPQLSVAAIDPDRQRALDPEGRAGWNLNLPGDYERVRQALERGHSALADPRGSR